MQKLAGNDQKKPMAEVQRELRRLGHRIEPVGGSKDQWEAGMWHMDKEQWNLLWTGEQWACGSLQERTEETELRKWEPMARHQRVLMLLAGVSLLLNRAESFNVTCVFPHAGVRRVAGNARHRRSATRMPFLLGAGGRQDNGPRTGSDCSAPGAAFDGAEMPDFGNQPRSWAAVTRRSARTPTSAQSSSTLRSTRSSQLSQHAPRRRP
jgi:hypothetical protein